METHKDKRILILAGRSESTVYLFNFLKSSYPNITVLVEDKPNRWKFIKRRVKKLGWLTAMGQILFQVSVPKILKITTGRKRQEVMNKLGLNATPISTEKLKYVKSVNSKKCIALIKKVRPDIIILNGTRIVSKKVLDSVSCKFINTHLGITPLYRGVHGGYWALVKNDKKNFGATIHIVDKGIDTGRILQHVYVNPEPKDNFIIYPIRQLAAALPILKNVLKDIFNDEAMGIESKAESSLWYHPTIFQYLSNYLLKGVR